ncbi:unnamed protein product [Urochloa decumbens]|uniref:Glycosyltransferase n=1 Tax=Urochloa decumbens TaxID=240449 RepID=A0ABC9D3Y9_9POAL
MATVEEKASPHVVLFPFLAHGHVPAFLRLADLLRARRPGLEVTLVSTPRILGTLSLPPASSPPLRLHALPFSPADHGLPPGADSLADIQVHQFITFFQASESLRPAFEEFLSGITSSRSAPVCVVSDAFFGWTADVARANGASHAVFLPGGAFGNAVFFSVWEHLPHARTDADEFPLLPDFPGITLHRTQIPRYMLPATGADPWSAFFRRVAASCRDTGAILVNTVRELEPSGLDMLRRSFGAPTWPIGPVLAAPAPSDDDAGIIQWLDAHPPRSVLYVSFGSQNSITADQMRVLARGLEASGRPFLWALRPPLGFDAKGGAFRAEWLPAGFEERAARAGTGKLVRGWAPQVRILSHPCTGAFLTHCGWNSVLESLSAGVPLLGWPLGAEQFFNAKLVAEQWGVCVEVARGNVESSAVAEEEVAEGVRTVMGETAKGEEMRRKAAAIARAMADAWEEPGGSAAQSLEGFLRCVEMSVRRDAQL